MNFSELDDETIDWLAKEVLPSIRKTGSYVIGQGKEIDEHTHRKQEEILRQLLQEAEREAQHHSN